MDFTKLISVKVIMSIIVAILNIRRGLCMEIFDTIGPVMIGPSSSHTAGAVRMGQIVARLLTEKPSKVVIKLHGSFAKTYKGHGTDRAIVGGLLDMAMYDERIGRSIELAQQSGIKIEIILVELNNAHPNTAIIEVDSVSGKKLELLGESIDGGKFISI